MSDTYDLILYILMNGELKKYFMRVSIDETLSETDEEFVEKVTAVMHRKAPWTVKNKSQILDIEMIDGTI